MGKTRGNRLWNAQIKRDQDKPPINNTKKGLGQFGGIVRMIEDRKYIQILEGKTEGTTRIGRPMYDRME